MKILITGAQGFLGKNLVAELTKNYSLQLEPEHELLLYDRDTDEKVLDDYLRRCEFIFHFAGINRPERTEEFQEGNFGFIDLILKGLRKYKNSAPILMTSSIQAEQSNPYGISKKQGEDLLFAYGKETGSKVLIYRLSNVFGKWSRPNYNSVVATFCYNISRGLPIQIHNEDTILHLIYIDDFMDEMKAALFGKENRISEFCSVPITSEITLGRLAKTINSFYESRNTLAVPDLSNELEKKLYSTYLSFLPENSFSYPLTMHIDERGSFTEFIRTADRGQVSVNVSKPGIEKGNHWHHSKNEKFLVVKGEALIQFRKIDKTEVIEYYVNDQCLQVVEIPPGYTHNIKNTGTDELITVMWANELFDPNHPDTWPLKVNIE